MRPKEIAYFYATGGLGSFRTGVMDLIGKADTINRDKIALAFPEYIEAYKLWFYKPDGWNNIKKEIQDEKIS